MADPRTAVAMAAQQAVHFVGMPSLALAEAVVYLATAPKAFLYVAYSSVEEDIEKPEMIPFLCI